MTEQVHIIAEYLEELISKWEYLADFRSLKFGADLPYHSSGGIQRSEFYVRSVLWREDGLSKIVNIAKITWHENRNHIVRVMANNQTFGGSATLNLSHPGFGKLLHDELTNCRSIAASLKGAGSKDASKRHRRNRMSWR